MSTSASGESRSERKRNNILAAAKDIFSLEGFSQTGMEQVARIAGVSTATLYAHFPSKADLFRVVVEDMLAEMADKIRRSVTVNGGARERLTAFAGAYAAFHADPASRALFRMIVTERRRFPDLAEHVLQRGRTELGQSLLVIVRALAEDGEIRVPKASWAAGQLQGMIEQPTLMLGLISGDGAKPVRPLEVIVSEAVETFLARYAVRETAA